MALDDDTLQRYYDAALSPDEARRVRAELETSANAQERLRELSRLTSLMQDAVLPRARALDSDALFASIEADIRKQEALGFGARLRVITSEWIEHKRGVLVPAFASAAVAAAALITFLVPREARDPESALPDGSPMAALVQVVHGSSIEQVDFGASTGTVFEVESDGVRAAVVWIAEDDEGAP